MCLSGYMKPPKEPDFPDLRPGMEYLIHHPHEPIMYSRKNIFMTNEIPHQCFFKTGDAEIMKNWEYFNFLHTY